MTIKESLGLVLTFTSLNAWEHEDVLQVDPVGGFPLHLENAIDHLGVLVQQQNGGHMEECFTPSFGLAGVVATPPGPRMCSGSEMPLRHS